MLRSGGEATEPVDTAPVYGTERRIQWMGLHTATKLLIVATHRLPASCDLRTACINATLDACTSGPRSEADSTRRGPASLGVVALLLGDTVVVTAFPALLALAMQLACNLDSLDGEGEGTTLVGPQFPATLLTT